MICPHCNASLIESGVIVRVEEDRLYMRESFGSDLVLAATLTCPRVTRVQCRVCFEVLRAKVVEALRIGS